MRKTNSLTALSIAARQLAKLRQQESLIIKRFPMLADIAGSPDNDTAARPVRRRRKRSAAERKAQSLRMKKIWAERRKKANA